VVNPEAGLRTEMLVYHGPSVAVSTRQREEEHEYRSKSVAGVM